MLAHFLNVMFFWWKISFLECSCHYLIDLFEQTKTQVDIVLDKNFGNVEVFQYDFYMCGSILEQNMKVMVELPDCISEALTLILKCFSSLKGNTTDVLLLLFSLKFNLFDKIWLLVTSLFKIFCFICSRNFSVGSYH